MSLEWLSQHLSDTDGMLAANNWTEQVFPNRGVRGRTEEAEGVCNPIGRTTISTNQTPQSSQGLNYQPKSTHGATNGSSCVCSRGLPYLSSIGEEPLGPGDARCPIIGKC